MNEATIYRLQGFVVGICTISLGYYLFARPKRHNEIESDDSCNSLFYGDTLATAGHGFPSTKSINAEIVSNLTKVHKEYCRLPFDFYKNAVESLPILCVDVVCMRRSDRKILIFYRRDKPAAKIWWLPGGRMFKGETFFATAIRKIRDETGDKDARVTPTGLINTWNTFFPDSNWDEGRAAGREGTQTVNISVFCELDDEKPSDSKLIGANSEWAVDEQKWVTVEEALSPGLFDKYIRLNVQRAKELNYF
jgi:ADP-ribose pyrophosphatase YjhB (NUDIX family)